MPEITEDTSRASDARTRKTAILAATVSGFLTPFMGSSINVALPAIAREFSIGSVSLGWIAMSYMLAAAVFLVPFGRLADIIGRKKIFVAGISVYTAASGFSVAAQSSGWLIAFRAVQGLGGAMIFGTGVAILTSVCRPEERGRVLGINTAAVYLGLSLGPVVGGFLTQRMGWRSLFLANVPIGLFVLILAAKKLAGEWADARGEKFDVTGSIVFGLGLAALMIGFSRIPAAEGFGLIGLGSGALIAFILIEGRIDAPVLDIRLLRNNRVFAFSNAAALINYSATSAVTFLMSLYLQYVKGFGPQKAGLILIAQPVVMAAVSPLAGRLSDRIEPRLLASSGMALSGAGLFLFTFLEPGTPLMLIIADLVCLGIGFGFFSSPNTHAVMGSVTKRHYGVASSTLGTMRLVGQMFSMGISVLIIALVMGNVRIGPGTAGLFLRSAKAAFPVFGVLCFAGILASLARGNRTDPSLP